MVLLDVASVGRALFGGARTMHGVTLPPRRFGDLSCLGRRRHNTGWQKVPRHHRFWIKCAWLHGNDSLLPLSVSVRTTIFLESPTLRFGHPALGCNNHKANATITEVDLGSTITSETAELLHWLALSRRCLRQFFRVVHTLCSCGLVLTICYG